MNQDLDRRVHDLEMIIDELDHRLASALARIENTERELQNVKEHCKIYP